MVILINDVLLFNGDLFINEPACLDNAFVEIKNRPQDKQREVQLSFCTKILYPESKTLKTERLKGLKIRK